LASWPESSWRGCWAGLERSFDSGELIEAVKPALGRGKEYLHKRGERREAHALIDKLTPREFEVMQLVTTSMLNKQIAAELHTVEKTIEVHSGRVMQKLSVTSLPDLVRVSSARNPA